MDYSEFDNASIECARYIFDSDCEQVSYEEHIRDGNDPTDHILYYAGVVLGKADKFQNDVMDYHNGQVS